MKLFILAVTAGLVSCQIKPGGVVPQDPKHPMFQNPARVAATHTDNQMPLSLSSQYGPRYQVVAASTQVVEGLLYRMTLNFTSAKNLVTLCEVEVLEQSWHNYIGLSGTPNCHAVNVKQEVPGGYKNVDSNSTEVQAAATFAVDAMNKQSHALYRNMLIEVISAEQQVVAGLNYKLVLSVGVSSSCINDDTTELTLLDCPVDQRKQRCEVIVWDQPWRTPRYELTSFRCQTLCDVEVMEHCWDNYIGLSGTPNYHALNVKQQVPGGYKNVDSTSPEVQAAATFAVDSMKKRSSSLYMLIEVTSAQQQVVAGMNYKLVLSVGVSSCCRNDGTKEPTLLNCPVVQRCDVMVWDQPWRTPRYELISFHCQTLYDVEALEQSWLNYIGVSGTPNCHAVNVKQQVPGGYEIVDSNSPEVQAAAASAVDAMNKQSNVLYMLIKVISAQQQVLAELNYKLVMSVGVSSSCTIDGTTEPILLNCPVEQRCNVMVWGQPWRTPRYKLTSFQCQ